MFYSDPNLNGPFLNCRDSDCFDRVDIILANIDFEEPKFQFWQKLNFKNCLNASTCFLKMNCLDLKHCIISKIGRGTNNISTERFLQRKETI